MKKNYWNYISSTAKKLLHFLSIIIVTFLHDIIFIIFFIVLDLLVGISFMALALILLFIFVAFAVSILYYLDSNLLYTLTSIAKDTYGIENISYVNNPEQSLLSEIAIAKDDLAFANYQVSKSLGQETVLKLKISSSWGDSELTQKYEEELKKLNVELGLQLYERDKLADKINLLDQVLEEELKK